MDIKQKLLGDPVSEQYGTNKDSGATPGSSIAYRRLKNEHPETSAPTIQVATQSTHSTIRSPNPESSLNRAQQEQNATPVDSVKTKKVLLGIKGFIGVVFLFVVLVSSVLSKLTLFSLADRLRNATYYPNASKKDVTEQERTTAVTLYWYLQFVLLIPNFVTLVRCLAFGVVGKTTRTYPWPRARAIFLGIAGSVIEVVVMTTFVYLVLPEISPGAGILLLCGVFSFQIIVDFCYTQNWFWCQHDGCHCAQQGHDFSRLHRRSKVEYVVCIVQLILENRVVKILALVLQITGIFGFIAVWVTHMKHRGYNIIRPMVGYPLGIIILSVLWSTWFQEKIATPHGNEPQNSRARYKSSRW